MEAEFTLIAPIELNFLVFMKKIYDKSWYSELSNEYFHSEFDEKLALLWNKRVDSIMENGKYIMNQSIIREDVKELVDQKIVDSVINQFMNLWNNLPPNGFGSLMERTCGTLIVEQLKKLSRTHSTTIMIIFDIMSEKYKKEDIESNYEIIPFKKFFVYI
ncbi:MAG TPA: hypothetical protein GXX18_12070 [Bacillales bacterium]|nr:hypothetical protein [Bacillales bacterium]